MPCNAIARTSAQVESPFLDRLVGVRSVQERVAAFFAASPDLDAERLQMPDPQAVPPRPGYSYYARGTYVSISDAGAVTVKASRWSRPKMESVARGIKAAMEDEMARVLRKFVGRVVEADGGTVVATEDEPGCYSLTVEI